MINFSPVELRSSGEGSPSPQLANVSRYITRYGAIVSSALSKRVPDLKKARAFQSLCPLPWEVAAPVSNISETMIRGLKAIWVRPPMVGATRSLLYLHGGGYVMGSAADYLSMLDRLAVATQCSVLAVDYRLAPEHTFPAALDDAMAAYESLSTEIDDRTSSAKRFFIAGDSAGGGLAIALAYKIRDSTLPNPDALVCFAPWLDLTFQANGASLNAEVKRAARRNAKMYIGNDRYDNPLISPFHGDPSGLPPLLLQVGEADAPGLADSIPYAKKALAAGVDVRLEIWRHMPHVWQAFAPFLPEAEQALEAVANYLERKA